MTDLKKPVKRIARGIMPHGFKSDIVVILYPSGIIGLREIGRRNEYKLSISELYKVAIMREAGYWPPR